MTGKLLIIDCDAGVDDALALIILLAAHKKKEIEIKAITCVNGNTIVENVVKNVFRTLNVCEVTNIPVFQGAHEPILCTHHTDEAKKEQYHGSDGFGNAYKTEVDTNILGTEHAVCAIHRIVSENPNQISVVCLGPLTNIATAIKMYPDFVNNVKDFYIMGGNVKAQGNITPQAEFNFYMDPESVHIVFNKNKKPLWLLPWETCCMSRVTHDWRWNVLGQIDTPCMKLMNDIESACNSIRKKHFPTYITCDAFLAGIILKPEIAQDVVQYHADIELNGNRTRGQVVLDHLLSNEPNVFLIQQFDSEMFKDLLISSVNM
ncbi:inosine-uridine preferring nucleoside hydrolase [Megalopta genalis]|uniref:inosine-uridine preferring nucleoside hydrolase n=1 Tax=Megalopta genalis TaxID=115081 RepID=UPI001442EF86|nr:inosine-uridine preferring nucleoside hydrolase-like [Megalopta genalis]XP_033340553.1 inosine-uridine preferring nucleoside hydrolase-like [Megalopta genalis]